MTDKAEPFLPTDNKQVLARVAKARRHNAAMDRVERSVGFAVAVACDLSLRLRTAISAIVCGLELAQRGDASGGLDCVAEGLVLIQDIELEARRNQSN